MMKKLPFALRFILKGLLFLLIFALILTALTLIYLPKWDPEKSEGGQVAGLYKEPDNTLDVIFLGSCNMYSSVSPVLLYEEYGVTGYVLGAPDEEMSSSYYLLKEALKTQKPKAVVVESLFLTMFNTGKRESYNRYVFDYTPPSFNEAAALLELSGRESAQMKKTDPTAPDTLLTFAGYAFPLLRYHGRTDLSAEDLTFFFQNDLSGVYKGGYPIYSYTTNDGNFFDRVDNGTEINEMSLKYVPKIKELCEKHGIPLIFVKSPNYMRWGYDDETTSIVREYVEGLGLPFIDMHKESEAFEEYEYGYQTGRLNVYGVRKFTRLLGKHLTGETGLEPTALSDADKASWDACVKRYYDLAAENGMPLGKGEIAEISSEDGALRVRWNPAEGAESVDLYRAEGHSEEFSKIASGVTGEVFDDAAVENGLGYTYRITVNGGEKNGASSQSVYSIYLARPTEVTAKNENGSIALSWHAAEAIPDGLTVKYNVARRLGGKPYFTPYGTADGETFVNGKTEEGKLHYYRIRAYAEEDGVTYYSKSTIVSAVAQKTPVLTGITAGKSSITIKWNKLTSQKSVQIYRKGPEDGKFLLLDTVDGKKTQYVDKQVEPEKEYLYRIRSVAVQYSVEGKSAISNTLGGKILK